MLCLTACSARVQAITFDSAASTAVTNAASVTWSHVVGSGSNQVLVVALNTEDTSSTVLNVGSISYNGVALTAVANSSVTFGTGTLDRAQLFYLLNPPAGTHTVSVTFGGAVNGVSAGSVSLNDVAQSAPAAVAVNSTSGNAISASIAVSAAGSWLVDAACSGASNVTLTSAAGQTKRWGLGQTSSSGASSTAAIGASGTATVSWTASSSGQLALAVAAFAPVENAAPTGPSISAQPQDQTVATGQSASFSVTAAGTAPLGYQWLGVNGPISGATNSILTLTNVQSSDAGGYAVTVTNSVNSITSGAATLTVTAAPIPPTITTQPQSQTILAGQSATFSVTGTGTMPLSYQWLKNNSPISSATNSSLTILNAQATDAATYKVVVKNSADSVTSDPATLAVNNAPPIITTQPASQSALPGSAVSFTVAAVGSASLNYQWFKGTDLLASATTATLSLANVQSGDVDSYKVIVANPYGNATSNPATLTVSNTLPYSAFNLTGFGRGASGGGVILETDPAYAKVTTPLELANALLAFNKTGSIKVIEIMNDLDLGWNEVGASVQNLTSSPFTQAVPAKLHPRLIQTGVSKVDVKYKNGGLTIFSANGATIRHATLNIKNTFNIIVRNLKFDEMWEWDEVSKGDYDKNDWDFIDLGNGGTVHDIWIDHCTFTKAYDGMVDTKGGSYDITFSWCKYLGDDGATNANSFVRQQLAALEGNAPAYPFYNFLRTNGFSVEDIVTISQGHDKTHLLGANSKDTTNNAHSMTLHHQWALNLWDRAMPRLRAGNVHDYNNYIDDTGVLAARRLRDTRAAVLSAANQNTLDNTYSFNPPINGSISTENGALLVEKSVYLDCLWPLRNNQTDPGDASFTGKIQALDTIYIFHNTNGTITTIRGDSTDPGNPLGPFQAPIIAFSWNLPGNQLPYTYTADDPAQLATILASGGGAGTLTWSKDNWLRTSYASNTPVITQQPVNQTRHLGETATFSVSATSTTALSYQWRKDGVSLTSATNATYTISNINWADDGGYSVLVTNAGGSVPSSTASLDIPGASYVSGYGLDPATNGAATADPDGDAITNELEWFLNGDPTQFDEDLLPTIARSASNGAGVFEFYRRKDAAGIAYIVQYSPDLKTWNNAEHGQAGVTISASSFSDTLDRITVTIPAGGAKLFVRLRL